MQNYLKLNFDLPEAIQHYSFKVYPTDKEGEVITQKSYTLDDNGTVLIPTNDPNVGTYMPFQFVLRNGNRYAGSAYIRQATAFETDTTLFFRMTEMGTILPVSEAGENTNHAADAVSLSKPDTTQVLEQIKLKGRIIDKAGEAFANSAFILYVQDADNQASGFRPLLLGVTDTLGAFSLEVPNQRFAAAQVTVGKVYDEPMGLILTAAGKLPAFTLLVSNSLLEEIRDKYGDDCLCKQPTNRLPEMEDLLNPEGKYQQDIGAGCTNFTTPNRALEEFSFYKIVRTTDPEVVSQTVLFQVEQINEELRNLRSKLLTIQRTRQMQAGRPTAKVANAAANSALAQESLADEFPINEEAVWPEETEIQRLEAEILNLEQRRNHLYHGASGRNTLGMQHSLDWDNTPTTHQATTIAHGHILEFRQVWRADGYSMGDLLYSLPLAPGQKKQIAIFDWDRKEAASRTEEQSQEESLQNTLSRDRDVSDIVKSTFEESLSGNSSSSSNSTTKSVSTTIGTPPISPVQASVTAGISNTKSSATSSASQESSRDLAASSMQHLRDKTMQSASAVRSQRATVIQAVNQGESMQATTESVANYNHCHAMTVQYFEVLRHFAVQSELADVQECLFVPLPITPFDNGKVMRWREILLQAVGNRSFTHGFDAVARAEQARLEGSNTTAYADLPANRYADERFTYIDVQLKLSGYLARPEEIYPDNSPTLQTILSTTNTSAFNGASPQALLEEARQNALLQNQDDVHNWRQRIGFIPGWNAIRYRVLSAPAAQRNALFQQEIDAADWFTHFVSQTAITLEGILPIPGELRVLSRSLRQKLRMAQMQEFTIGVTFNDPAGTPITRERISKLTYQGIVTSAGNNALDNLPDGSLIRITAGQGHYRTGSFSAALFNSFSSSINLAEAGVIEIPTPLTHEELRNPRQELERARIELIEHLNNNLEVYHSWLFFYMSPERRYMMLDGIQVKVPHRQLPGQPAPGPNDFTLRSVASVVENRIVSIVGNTLVMPVAKGFNVDPTFRYDSDTVTLDDGTQLSLLMYHYMPKHGFKTTPFRISVPTKGVFAEAVMGACNSCERIDDTRFWKWEEHPIPDSPTAIQPISTDTRRADVGNLQTKDFEQPMVNIQNAPTAPDYQGLKPALDLLANSEAFRDVTGQAGTQKLVSEGLAASGAAQMHAMDKATEITKQAMTQKKNQSLTQQIKQSGLPNEKKEELLEELIRTQISGNPKKEKPKDDPKDNPIEEPKPKDKPSYGPESTEIDSTGVDKNGIYAVYKDGRKVYLDPDGKATNAGETGKDEFGVYQVDEYGRKLYEGETYPEPVVKFSSASQDALRSGAYQAFAPITDAFAQQFPEQPFPDNPPMA